MDLNKLIFGQFQSVFGPTNVCKRTGSNVVTFVPQDKREDAGRKAKERAIRLGYRSKTVLDAVERSAKRAANRKETAQATADRIVGHPQESAVVGHGPEAA